MKLALIGWNVVTGAGALALSVFALAAPTAAPSTQPATQPATVNKFCAVEQEHPVNPKVTTVYKGKTVGFCCKDCIPEFEKDPEKYMKDLK